MARTRYSHKLVSKWKYWFVDERAESNLKIAAQLLHSLNCETVDRQIIAITCHTLLHLLINLTTTNATITTYIMCHALLCLQIKVNHSQHYYIMPHTLVYLSIEVSHNKHY